MLPSLSRAEWWSRQLLRIRHWHRSGHKVHRGPRYSLGIEILTGLSTEERAELFSRNLAGLPAGAMAGSQGRWARNPRTSVPPRRDLPSPNDLGRHAESKTYLIPRRLSASSRTSISQARRCRRAGAGRGPTFKDRVTLAGALQMQRQDRTATSAGLMSQNQKLQAYAAALGLLTRALSRTPSSYTKLENEMTALLGHSEQFVKLVGEGNDNKQS